MTARSDDVEPVLLRRPTPGDEDAVTAAQAELAADGFDFALREAGESFDDWLAALDRQQRGVDLPEGRVAATFLLAEHDGQVVGRVSIRHALTPFLLHEGGHIGYGVRPAWRRRGFAGSILRQSLQLTDTLGLDRVLVTCDDDNVASAAVIEGAGGALEDVRAGHDGTQKRRYWIDRSAQVPARA